MVGSNITRIRIARCKFSAVEGKGNQIENACRLMVAPKASPTLFENRVAKKLGWHLRVSKIFSGHIYDRIEDISILSVKGLLWVISVQPLHNL